jgi:hypothetical protein
MIEGDVEIERCGQGIGQGDHETARLRKDEICDHEKDRGGGIESGRRPGGLKGKRRVHRGLGEGQMLDLIGERGLEEDHVASRQRGGGQGHDALRGEQARGKGRQEKSAPNERMHGVEENAARERKWEK